MKSFGYSVGDFIACELTGQRANDIHHIEARGIGGDPTGSKDRIENLMAITRDLHDRFGDDNSKMAYLFKVHKDFMVQNGVQFDENYIDEKIIKYSGVEQLVSS